MERLSIRAALALVLAGAGFLCAFALAGCGGSGNVSGEGPTRSVSLSVTRPGTVTASPDPTVTVTQSQPVLTTTQVRPTVTTQPTTVQLTTQPTTVQLTIQSTPATTAAETSSGGTPTWVWVLVAVAGAALIGLLAALLTRGRGPKELSGAERQQVVAAAVASWTAQGWQVESQAESSAIVQRDGERVFVDVDARGNVTTRPLSGGGDAWPG
jgi:hypothetical protein